MKQFLFTIFLLLLMVGCKKQYQQENAKKSNNTSLKLNYNEPARYWEEALPIGNGRLGGMIFGGTLVEKIQLNEESVWAGEPGNNLPQGFMDVLPEVRSLIFEKKYKEANDLLATRFPRHAPKTNNYGMPYQTVGDIVLKFPDHKNIENYHRDLDISNAISTTTYTVDDVKYTREYLASVPDQVIAVSLTASELGKINVTIGANTPHSIHSISVENNSLVISGKGDSVENKEGKVVFNARFKPVLEGGKLIEEGNELRIEGANKVTIYISIATNFVNYNDISANEAQRSIEFIDKASIQSFSEIKNAHTAYYKKFFDRVELDLGVTDSIHNTTDKRIVDFANGNDPQLVALYFQFGRYLLISSSQPGTQPANLQGIWNHKLKPSWDSKYTININTEMNYWPAEVTGLSEMHEPLFSMVKDLSETGKDAAEQMYGARGWVTHHNTDIWRITGPIDGTFYGMWPMGGAWLSQHLWQHYLFTGDKDFLDKNFQILKGVATFYADILKPEPTNGWLVVVPSMSPENKHPEGISIAPGNTMDNQLVFDVFSNVIEASETLGRDINFADSLRLMRSKLPPMQIGRHKQLQEWMFDWDRVDDKHRHVSHLYGLYPSNQVSPFSSPELFQAAKNSLEYRGDKSTGWSMGWKVNLWARLLDGDRAYKLIEDQLSPSPMEKKGEKGGTYPNLFDAHPPFQIDGNFGCTAGVAEMLLQSHDGAVHLLPALPSNWNKEGIVKGLEARGGFTITQLKWENGEVKSLVVTSKLGGNLRLRLPNEIISQEGSGLTTATGINSNKFYKKNKIIDPLVSKEAKLNDLSLSLTYSYDLLTEIGGVYRFKIKH